jgi:hypothetical protein
MPETQKGQIMREYSEVIQGIVKSGHFRGGAQLQPTSTSTTVREKDGKLITIDGPFAETKEQLGGYHLVECRDLDEAIAIAGRIPTLRVGGAIEVRPVVQASGGESRRPAPERVRGILASPPIKTDASRASDAPATSWRAEVAA